MSGKGQIMMFQSPQFAEAVSVSKSILWLMPDQWFVTTKTSDYPVRHDRVKAMNSIYCQWRAQQVQYPFACAAICIESSFWPEQKFRDAWFEWRDLNIYHAFTCALGRKDCVCYRFYCTDNNIKSVPCTCGRLGENSAPHSKVLNGMADKPLIRFGNYLVNIYINYCVFMEYCQKQAP